MLSKEQELNLRRFGSVVSEMMTKGFIELWL